MGRDRIYYDNADRQRAYRERQRDELESLRRGGGKRQAVSAKLVKVLGMLGSAHAGERANAALAASQILKEAGLTWYDVLDVPRRKK
jgi:hypothetical protein